MPYKISKVDVWTGPIEDKPGGLAVVLDALSAAGAQLEFLLARRDVPGKGVVFLAPLKGAKQTAAAKNACLAKGADLAALRIDGPDKPGIGATVAKALAAASINLRGLSAAAIGRQSVFYLAFDNKDDAAKAQRALAKALSGK